MMVFNSASPYIYITGLLFLLTNQLGEVQFETYPFFVYLPVLFCASANDRGRVFVIDVSQGMEENHPLSLDFLRMDCRNINSFFKR